MKGFFGCLSVILAMLPGIGSARAASATAPAVTDTALLAQLEKVDAHAASVRDISAKFEQSKFTPMLKKPLVSKGTIRAAGSCMVWDTVAPTQTIMRIDGASAAIYYPQEKLEEIYPVTGQLGALAVSPLPRLERLKKYFNFSADDGKDLGVASGDSAHLAVRLTPIEESLREHVDHVRVLLDVESGLMIRCEITDSDGDRSLMSFSDVRINTNVSEEQMTLRVPVDVKVVRPMENLSVPAETSSGNQNK